MFLIPHTTIYQIISVFLLYLKHINIIKIFTTMTTKIISRMRFILLIGIVLSFTNCIDDEYDLSSGINTEMSVGGDSLSFPIIQTTKIFLDSMMNSQDIQMLKRLADGTYSFQMYDSMQMNLGSIAPVTLSIAPISIAPISSNFSNIELPVFQLNPINFETLVNIPDFSVESELIKPIDVSYTQKYPIDAPSNIRRNTKSGSSKIKSENVIIGPFRKIANQSITELLFFRYPNALKRINKVTFKNTKVTLTFDKTNTNQLNLVSQSDTIKEFRIDFPAEYKITMPTGLNSRIEGSSFIIKNAPLAKGVNIFTASFYIESLDMTDYFQFETLNYNKPINYSIDYNFVGVTDDLSSLMGKDVEYNVSLQASPVVNDIEIETNSFNSDMKSGSISISKIIENIPTEISEIKTVTFEDNAKLQISVPDPGLNPFTFSSGICQIELPKSIIFKPFNGLDTATNILTIPYNEIIGTKDLGISGLKVNKTIPEGQNSILISDELKYTISGISIGSQKVSLRTVQAMNNKIIKISGICSGMVVKDAALSTRRISIDLPQKNTNINISRFVSKDVKRIYSATLKTPSDVTFNIKVSNLPTSIDSVFFENYTIKLPEYLKFKTGNVNNQNEVILNRGFKVSEGFSKTLTLEKFDFGATGKLLENGVFTLNDVISMQGKVYIKGTNLNTNELGTIEIKPSFQLSEISLSLIEGEIVPQIAPINKTIPLNLPDYLKQENTKLDLQNPVITIQIGNSMGIGVEADVTLIPKRNGVAIADATVNCHLDIAAAHQLGESTWSKFWISKSNEGVSDQYQPVIVPEIANLLKIAPDEVEIIVTPIVSGSRQLLDLYSPKNTLEMKYALNVPLDFGTEFNINYADTLISLKEKLNDIIKYTRQIEVIAIINNTIPLNLNFEVKPLNVLNQEISGITIESEDSITSCNIDGTAQKSNLNLTIKETENGSLDQLDAFAFKVFATKSSTIAGMPLKVDQYITLEIRVRIPDGITINQSTTN